MDVARRSTNAPSADDYIQAPSQSSVAPTPDAESDEWLASERRGCQLMFLALLASLALWAGIVWAIILLVDRLKAS